MAKTSFATGMTGALLISALNNNFTSDTSNNVRDSGAGNGIVDDATVIQAAIDEMAAVSNVAGRGGTVIIPAGDYVYTKTVVLKSFVTVQVANNAHFIKSVGNVDPYYTSGSILESAYLTGGYYVITAGKFFASTIPDGSHMVYCRFSNIETTLGSQVFEFIMTGSGWCNANVFENIVSYTPVSFLKTRGIAGAGFEGNSFTNIAVQVGDNCANIIDGFEGYDNTFVNFYIWDFANYAPQGAYTVKLSASSGNNILIGSCLTDTGFVDSGTNNLIIDRGQIMSSFLKLKPLSGAPTGVEGLVYADINHHLYYFNGTEYKQLDN